MEFDGMSSQINMFGIAGARVFFCPFQSYDGGKCICKLKFDGNHPLQACFQVSFCSPPHLLVEILFHNLQYAMEHSFLEIKKLPILPSPWRCWYPTESFLFWEAVGMVGAYLISESHCCQDAFISGGNFEKLKTSSSSHTVASRSFLQ